ncbi:hypothetical protein L596_013911 [Steinernema carpocapsae]|uniref:TIL domain-containing protein n=1 Tax=Steinernema carpocapsae TaxID=34508 RepID=A0A4U5P2P9_STECR|nr:hypothetical protein L596_013911 [Steinernema carpocapsae]
MFRLLLASVLILAVFATKDFTCPPNERVDHCGGLCEPTCENHNGICPAVCLEKDKCVCEQGLFRNKDGTCVPEFQCPFYNPCHHVKCSAGYHCVVKVSPCLIPPCPRNGVCVPDLICPTNEHVDHCGGLCDRFCKNPNRACPALCKLEDKCVCDQGYYRNNEGTCVPEFQCPGWTNPCHYTKCSAGHVCVVKNGHGVCVPMPTLIPIH